MDPTFSPLPHAPDRTPVDTPTCPAACPTCRGYRKNVSMGQTRDELLQAAQAEIDRILDVHSELQADLDAVQERLNQLPSEPVDTFSARAEPYDDEYDRIKAKMAEADDDYRRASQAYVDLEAELDELDSDDGDSGEALRAAASTAARART